eukprot:CAMPEP_0194058076 /NCGR_PEP_ID=MMETSP0009_2-20130614/65138_1 /TAXON_ID=210454 /ORGANISM="Grammatophora oceanica, Strain CCMP 410" /LENGTH=246 /DNA_ID=CAMNT_0038708069 /DNA_START=71 /DNA_END=808 /DNA_ORIENTATION=+
MNALAPARKKQKLSELSNPRYVSQSSLLYHSEGIGAPLVHELVARWQRIKEPLVPQIVCCDEVAAQSKAEAELENKESLAPIDKTLKVGKSASRATSQSHPLNPSFGVSVPAAHCQDGRVSWVGAPETDQQQTSSDVGVYRAWTLSVTAEVEVEDEVERKSTGHNSAEVASQGDPAPKTPNTATGSKVVLEKGESRGTNASAVANRQPRQDKETRYLISFVSESRPRGRARFLSWLLSSLDGGHLL